ncbi:hypothetical protein BCV69DRAFT_202047 [Microstroma glucosiphilum]|uniref:Uncharacterized protein n=1 Tax=Pseudomicrostroma glucosiphilum TaxID=1684307 RepID=A0A316U4K0_9BASI|nr:hypothetical protein BCV69DRAFT_202047 [Pseudomicrostroma glucosiphilum]PWN20187.1 hypothetical protein BCV69DRAFT_202047 [Pseudomicrostroma glucosiphilum]
MSTSALTIIAAFTGRVASNLRHSIRDRHSPAADENEAMPSTAGAATSRSGLSPHVEAPHSRQSPPPQTNAEPADTNSAQSMDEALATEAETYGLERHWPRTPHESPISVSDPRTYGEAIIYPGRHESSRADQWQRFTGQLERLPRYDTLAPSAPPPDYELAIDAVWVQYEQDQAICAQEELDRRRQALVMADRRFGEYMFGFFIHDETYVAPTVWPW